MPSRATYALIGSSGYVAPRHMKSIKATGGVLRVAYDPHDAAGVIDSYFPDADFFTEFERFDRHVSKLALAGQPLDYVSICSPNYLHDAHVRHALRSGSDAICEKPLVLNPWNLDALADLEGRTGKRVNTILQLRLHPSVIALRERIQAADGRTHDVLLSYITPRGRWYHRSWKGDVAKSGGVATNIGVHFFDMLAFVFGPVRANVLHHADAQRSAGYLEAGSARISWFLSVDRNDLPAGHTGAYRSVLVDGELFEFSEGFTDLHTRSYEEVLAGRGFGIGEVRPSIDTVSALREAPVEPHRGEVHPDARKFVTA
jgi:UDP-N-acetyl-2-amino-2-deoxyglucuronate dehydrogenase